MVVGLQIVTIGRVAEAIALPQAAGWGSLGVV
jgi:hypothetical protein